MFQEHDRRALSTEDSVEEVLYLGILGRSGARFFDLERLFESDSAVARLPRRVIDAIRAVDLYWLGDFVDGKTSRQLDHNRVLPQTRLKPHGQLAFLV